MPDTIDSRPEGTEPTTTSSDADSAVGATGGGGGDDTPPPRATLLTPRADPARLRASSQLCQSPSA